MFTYVASGKSAFADIRKVDADGRAKISKVAKYDEIFNYGLITSPEVVLPEEKWVKIASLINDLEFIGGRKNWGNSMRTTLRKLSDADAAVIGNEIRRMTDK